LHEDLLEKVLSVGANPEHAQCQRKDERRVTIIELAESFTISIRCSPDKIYRFV
jgi:hypothetical protein